VRRILRAGVPASTTDGAGRSALTVAAGAGHLAIVEHLVRSADSGAAAATAADASGRTPMDEATAAGHWAVVRFLEEEVATAQQG